MDFGLSEEQVMLRTSAREFLDKECPKKLVRAMMDDEKGYSAELWKKMADVGWQGLVFPSQYGGADSSFLDLAVLLEEMGRALVPGPFVPTVVHVGRAILAAGTDAQKQQFLPQIASGDMIMTLALTEASDSLEASGITLKATPDGEEYVIEGTKLFVPDAHIADCILCVTRTKESANPEDGITLFLVDAKTAGIETEVLKTMTGEKLCEVFFSNVRVPKQNILGELNKGWPIVQRIFDEAAIAECAWMTGGIRWILETTVQYAKERIQFGVPIGSFQATQHKMANMTIEVEGSTSITHYAAWAASENSPELALAASMAKAWCSDGYKHAAFEGVQIHGGIGFTWDHDMHLYFKRAKSSEVAWGDGDYHRERIAKLLNM
ncbi:MAG: acyl-CoA/acyl-ACP dehydrogenase [Dehalococcoidales bacterium]|nr:acyl-CoA/acyl-ACP dehydrogenase [Dehalococcoidales bacterium]